MCAFGQSDGYLSSQSHRGRGWLFTLAVVWCLLNSRNTLVAGESLSGPLHREAYRGPVDLVIAEDESWAVTVNELSHTLSLIDLGQRRVVDEVNCGARPMAIALLPEGELLVSCRDAGLLQRFAVKQLVDGLRLEPGPSIDIGWEPLGLAVDGPRQRAFCGLQATGQVAEIDLQTNQITRKLSVGHWPRYLAVSPDGRRLAVGLSGESQIAVVDTDSGETLYQEPLSGGINLGHMRCSADGQHVYFPWMIYRTNPITEDNIRRGWVLASRVARVRLDGPAYREALALDVPRRAVADPHGLAITPDEQRMVVTSAGTHELLVYRLPDLPLVGAGGPGDLIDERLARDAQRFYRIELGGRPLGVQASRDNRHVWIANNTTHAVQVVDLESRQVAANIPLGSPAQDPQLVHAERGRELFHDAGRSLDQWYSCQSCHLDGGSNAKAMDTWNDGTELTTKTVLPLQGVTQTGPWTWHGWQQDLDESIENSFEITMQGPAVSPAEVADVRAYLATLKAAPNPFRESAAAQAAAAIERGRGLFHASEVGCAECHAGPNFTDGQIHDVGLGGDSDKYSGFNTPSLVGVYQKVRLLHDGRAKSLRAVLSEWHTPQEIGGGAELTAQQLDDLIAYLQTL